jgi:hypothetical protein
MSSSLWPSRTTRPGWRRRRTIAPSRSGTPAAARASRRSRAIALMLHSIYTFKLQQQERRPFCLQHSPTSRGKYRWIILTMSLRLKPLWPDAQDLRASRGLSAADMHQHGQLLTEVDHPIHVPLHCLLDVLQMLTRDIVFGLAERWQ